MTSMVLTIDKSFPSAYEFELLEDLPPGPLRVHTFSRPGSGPVSSGVLLRVRPEVGDSWIGVFAPGSLATRATTGVYTSPDPNSLCVVARGDGYLVDTNSPPDFTCVKASPIMAVYPIVGQGFLIFCDPWEVFAYNKNGLLWRTGRIAIDGISIIDISANIIRGVADRMDTPESEFIIELENGTVR